VVKVLVLELKERKVIPVVKAQLDCQVNLRFLLFIPVDKIAQKNSLKEFVFVNSVLKIQPCYQKYTPTDCFFGDFSHWDTTNLNVLYETYPIQYYEISQKYT